MSVTNWNASRTFKSSKENVSFLEFMKQLKPPSKDPSGTVSILRYTKNYSNLLVNKIWLQNAVCTTLSFSRSKPPSMP